MTFLIGARERGRIESMNFDYWAITYDGPLEDPPGSRKLTEQTREFKLPAGAGRGEPDEPVIIIGTTPTHAYEGSVEWASAPERRVPLQFGDELFHDGLTLVLGEDGVWRPVSANR